MATRFRIQRYVTDKLAAIMTLLGARPEIPLLQAYGYARSLRTGLPLDLNGAPLPWLPYCLIALLEQRLSKDLTVLEFGSGFSTLFFMTRVQFVTSIEHDRQWLERLRPQVRSNVRLLCASGDSAASYCEPLGEHGTYDLILVDGIHRVECLRRALGCVSERGVILLDDSDRAEYVEAFTLAAAAGFRKLSLLGHKSGSAGLHWSTIFYRDRNCLGI